MKARRTEGAVHIGHYISGAAHTLLIGWAIFGASIGRPPPPPEVTGVSIVTTEQFEAVMRAERPPVTVTEADVPTAPVVEDTPPSFTQPTDEAPDLSQPDNAEASEPDEQPDLSDITAPQPAPVEDEAPSLTPPGEEMAVLIPRDETRPMVRPTDRVAPEPVAAPEPDTQVDDTVREANEPDDSAGESVEDPVEATAPEEATTEIVTEAKEQVALAPKASLRPVLRPSSRPRPRPSAGANAASAAAVADVLGDETAAPSGPPLTQGEKDAMRISVQNCWVVDVGGQSSNVTVTVGFNLDRDGKVIGNEVKLLSSEGGEGKAIETAFQSARRAVLLCQKGGYNLPKEKYDHWREIEITFNPEKMRLK